MFFYFILKIFLKMEKQAIEDLSIGLFCQQQKYKMALNSLEEISEEVRFPK